MATVGRPRLYPDMQTKWRINKRNIRKAQQTNRKVYHRSLTCEWGTPPVIFNPYHEEFGFTVDVCALTTNAKCPRYFTPEMDGLIQDWGTDICWMNPPYGPTLGLWIAKAYASAQAGATVVCLVPVRTDTKWWHKYAQPFAEIRFHPGRITFIGATNPAPFPNAFVIYRPT